VFVSNRRSLVVDCYPPWKVRLLQVCLLAALGGGAWLWWSFVPQEVERRVAAHEGERLRLMDRLSSAQAEHARLRREAAALERARAMDRQAYRQLQESLQALQEETLGLREQVAFYQAIVSPEDREAGLKLQAFRLWSGDGPREYRFEVVLIQALRNEHLVQGGLSLRVSGTCPEGECELGLAELSPEAADKRPLRFRYFQNVDGALRLPEGFVPERVHLSVRVKNPHKDIERSFAWAELLG
jgi:hypothetical protein